MDKGYVFLEIHNGHGTGAALFHNGRAVAAVSGERMRNIRNFSGPPGLVVRKVLRIARVDPVDTYMVSIVRLYNQ